MNFLESIHCTNEAHCKTCRSTLRGKEFRDTLVASFDDIRENMFDCPKNKPWVKTKVTFKDGKTIFDGQLCVPCQKQKESEPLKVKE
tara:strand:+ start:240 stop:500 length:261 start_codon:yes stop_codon:yes gene_type:complete